MRYVPPKRRALSELVGITTHPQKKNMILIATNMIKLYATEYNNTLKPNIAVKWSAYLWHIREASGTILDPKDDYTSRFLFYSLREYALVAHCHPCLILDTQFCGSEDEGPRHSSHQLLMMATETSAKRRILTQYLHDRMPKKASLHVLLLL
jgi:hypothetical protein